MAMGRAENIEKPRERKERDAASWGGGRRWDERKQRRR